MAGVVGILGGMGPQATVDLMAKVIRATPARVEADHVHMLVDCNPTVPPRTRALLEGGEDPGPELVRMARGLVDAGAEVLAMPCNTAHAFSDRITAAAGVPLLDMIDLAANEVVTGASGAATVGVCATRGTRALRLYHDRLEARDVKVLDLPEADQRLLDGLIEGVKTEGVTGAARTAMHGILERLAARGAATVVAGCTELPLLLPDDPPVRVVDPTDVLAQAIVAQVGRGDDDGR